MCAIAPGGPAERVTFTQYTLQNTAVGRRENCRKTAQTNGSKGNPTHFAVLFAQVTSTLRLGGMRSIRWYSGTWRRRERCAPPLLPCSCPYSLTRVSSPSSPPDSVAGSRGAAAPREPATESGGDDGEETLVSEYGQEQGSRGGAHRSRRRHVPEYQRMDRIPPSLNVEVTCAKRTAK